MVCLLAARHRSVRFLWWMTRYAVLLHAVWVVADRIVGDFTWADHGPGMNLQLPM